MKYTQNSICVIFQEFNKKYTVKLKTGHFIMIA